MAVAVVLSAPGKWAVRVGVKVPPKGYRVAGCVLESQFVNFDRNYPYIPPVEVLEAAREGREGEFIVAETQDPLDLLLTSPAALLEHRDEVLAAVTDYDLRPAFRDHLVSVAWYLLGYVDEPFLRDNAFELAPLLLTLVGRGSLRERPEWLQHLVWATLAAWWTKALPVRQHGALPTIPATPAELAAWVHSDLFRRDIEFPVLVETAPLARLQSYLTDEFAIACWAETPKEKRDKLLARTYDSLERAELIAQFNAAADAYSVTRPELVEQR